MMNLLFLGGISIQEILVILLIILLFYGGKKVPEMMRGLGQGVKAFKDGMNDTTESLKVEEKNAQEKSHPQPPPEGGE